MAVYTVSISSAGSSDVVSVADGSTYATLEVSAGRGPKGAGWTGVTYSTETGRFTFTSNDGIGYVSDDITVGLDAAVTDAEAAQAAAEAAQAATESIFDQFGDQYLGPKASDPTVDNDGDPLTEGDIYFNTTDDVLKFYSGSAWVAPESIATTAANEAEASATAAAASETNAASSASAASTSETNAASSASAASTSETNAATSETNAASSASAASTSEINAAASETAAAASETAAAASETASATSEGNAASSASAASTSASNAATSESNAASSASAASTSETNAATSASNASTSETNAATSASSAATSASEAAASAASINPDSIDINGGTIDGTVIGGSTPAAGSFTTGSFTGDVSFGDNDKAIFGAGSDLQIYHSGSDSFVRDGGAGDLILAGNNLSLRDSNASEVYLAAFQSGEVHIRYDNAIKLATTSTGIDVTGTVTADGLTVDGDLSATGGDVDLDTLDLNAIAASKGVTAVDVFVYDTSKDSDGGAWRKRTQGTSWYNETLSTATRGSRREFPAVAVIVAESNKVTIYDGDDPALPMWMVFDQIQAENYFRLGGGVYAITSVSALGGILAVGFSGQSGYRNALTTVSFAEDMGRNYSSVDSKVFNGPVSQRNTANSGLGITIPATLIVSYVINDVAMTVLPNAPIDHATGLPVPTIAVATDGGVSVIKDDGTVVDSSTTNATTSVSVYGEDMFFVITGSGNPYQWVSGIGDLSDGFSTTYLSDFDTSGNYPAYGASASNEVSLVNTTAITGGLLGLFQATIGEAVAAGKRTGMVAYTTSTYNTGWMNGDIKGAFLSDTDDTDLVGSGELVTNGTFDADSDWTKGTGWTIGSGAATHAAGTSSNITQTLTLTPNAAYVVSYDITAVTAGTVRAQFGGTLTGTSNGSVGSYTETFVAPSGSVDLILSAGASFDGSIDNVSVKLADEDRSVNQNGLVINGTVTRSPVATGADLVAYSGFSASNYLEQPYNSDLDFGTGDFCVMGWVYNEGTGSTQYLFSRGNTGGDWRGIAGVRLSSSGTQYVSLYIGGGSITTTSALPVGWTLLTFKREDGVAKVLFGNTLVASGGNTSSVGTGEGLKLGGQYGGSGSFTDGSLALLRISATAPTAEQIAKIYNDEKVLFQENAQATLYGASDAVTALAHDDATNLLHVGTSAGRSVFQVLRRVDNTTTAVGTAISASNGLVVEE